MGENTIEDNSNGLFEVKQSSVNVALGIDIEPRSLLLIESAQKLSYTSSPRNSFCKGAFSSLFSDVT